MKLNEIIKIIEKVVPKEAIEQGDPCGLQIGKYQKDIRHIRVALEASIDVIEGAIKDDVDMLFVHHPLIYTPIQNICDDTVTGHKIQELIRSDIALYVAHSNMDRATNGLNRYFGNKIELEHITEMSIDTHGYTLIGNLKKPMSLKSYAVFLGQKLSMPNLKYVGDDQKNIEKAAFVTGSGMSLLKEEMFDEVDVFLTGDLKYHDAMWVYESGNCVIDVTHYGSEIMVTELMYELLLQHMDKSVIVSKDNYLVNPIKNSEV
ncbi:Nif3-like dinuclear metal center hexameric protein [Petrocella atlantisensis]|uniref:GTP cyclohydrolase 1 type 2 homolog n=1 Tax=Petrocella atlantisensis TaxID=2173034 RepID=A0A3P7PZT6_9FIRM|nr:Nif3-like dinuclear metal center hexameric protein [Petrocella atlantisensis]VDN49037.1 Nif3-like dinuclear metal center hexameric protein [Petrocella atlantisensis]